MAFRTRSHRLQTRDPVVRSKLTRTSRVGAERRSRTMITPRREVHALMATLILGLVAVTLVGCFGLSARRLGPRETGVEKLSSTITSVLPEAGR
jgi:hypothetical protein